MGTGTPSLIDCGIQWEAGSGSDRTSNTMDTANNIATATRRHDAANQHQRAEARKGKADTMSALSVEQQLPISTSGRRPAKERPTRRRHFP